MSDETVENLILDLLEWLGREPRPYPDVMEAWRTSCPKLPAWEEASERGFIEQCQQPGRGTLEFVSALGFAHLRTRRP